jgi:hypothetical protein
MEYRPSDIEGFVQTGGIEDNLRLYEKIDTNIMSDHHRGYNRLEKQAGGGMKRFQEFAIPSFIAVRTIEIHPFFTKVEDDSIVISETRFDEFLHKMHGMQKKSNHDTYTKKMRMRLKSTIGTKKREKM